MLDSLKDLNIYGQGLCDRWGRLLTCLAHGADMQARKIVSPYESGPTHTMCEIFYEDTDGEERWHWFDPHLGRYVYARNGKYIAAYADLIDDPQLYTDPVRTSQPFCVRENDPMHYKQWPPEKQADMQGYPLCHQSSLQGILISRLLGHPGLVVRRLFRTQTSKLRT